MSKSSKENLLNNGKKIMATYDSLILGRSGNSPNFSRNIICYYKDDQTDDVHLFESEGIWGDLSPIDKQKKLLVPVYVDHNDYSSYYVSVYEFFENNAEHVKVLSKLHGGSIEKPISQVLKLNDAHYPLTIIAIILVIAGVITFLLTNNVISILLGILGLLIFIDCLKRFFINKKLAEPKEIRAQLVSIENGSKWWHFFGIKFLYMLIFKCEKGLACYYPTNSIGDLEINNVYSVIVKGGEVTEIRDLVSAALPNSTER